MNGNFFEDFELGQTFTHAPPRTLGEGEIAVTLTADGESSFDETACPGVWWVTHRNPHGAVASAFIEVAFVPEVVKAHHEDVAIGLEHLESLISDLS